MADVVVRCAAREEAAGARRLGEVRDREIGHELRWNRCAELAVSLELTAIETASPEAVFRWCASVGIDTWQMAFAERLRFDDRDHPKQSKKKKNEKRKQQLRASHVRAWYPVPTTPAAVFAIAGGGRAVSWGQCGAGDARGKG